MIQEKEAENKLPDGWVVKQLGDVVDYVTDKIKVEKLTVDNYVSTENMLSNCEGVVVSAGVPNSGNAISYQINDILISNIRPYFKKIWLSNKTGGCSNDVLVLRNKDDSLFYAEFLYYYLTTNHFFDYVMAGSKGTKMPRGDKSQILQYQITIPPINEQKEIAAILSSLDDKIELNQQINKKLEKMAQAIFKEWFIDFNFPDESGNPYRDSGGAMIDSELGQIPASWSVGCFNDLISETIGGDWGKDTSQGNYNQEVLCIRGADIKELKTGNKSNAPKRYILEKNLKNKQLSSNDIVIEISGGSPTQSTGRTLFITNELLNQFKVPLICTNFCRRLRLNANHNSLFCYLYLNYLYDNDIFFNYENGTTGVKNLDTTNLFSKHQIILPSDSILQLFYEQIIFVINGVYFYGEQSQKISNTRDTLLPKLMSGHFSNYK